MGRKLKKNNKSTTYANFGKKKLKQTKLKNFGKKNLPESIGSVKILLNLCNPDQEEFFNIQDDVNEMIIPSECSDDISDKEAELNSHNPVVGDYDIATGSLLNLINGHQEEVLNSNVETTFIHVKYSKFYDIFLQAGLNIINDKATGSLSNLCNGYQEEVLNLNVGFIFIFMLNNKLYDIFFCRR